MDDLKTGELWYFLWINRTYLGEVVGLPADKVILSRKNTFNDNLHAEYMTVPKSALLSKKEKKKGWW